MIREDAIYARQSANREDSISIESQIEICEYETKGEPHRVFIDRGFSGKNTDRPQFQKMMESVRRGEIKRIICYKLDRCSRSVIDFVAMMEELHSYDVEFVSCTEKFDTSTPMGRAMLNICIIFAQLERETIQMRCDDAYKSMSQKGFYMGGRAPYGFNKEPFLIDGKRTSRYIQDETESPVVKLIYNVFREKNSNTGDVIRALMCMGIRNPASKDGTWLSNRIQSIICNPIYVKADLSIYQFFHENGAIIHNAPEKFDGIHGCYLYEDKSLELPKKRLRIKGHHLVLAPHEGYIPPDIWLDCRKKIKHSGDDLFDNSVKRNWLSGKIKCGKCGYALVVRSVPNSSIRNYVCSKSTATQSTCDGVGKLNVDQIEEVVLDEMVRKAKQLGALTLPSSTANPKISELSNQILKISKEIDMLMDKIKLANKILAQYINERIASLDKQKADLVEQLYNLQNEVAAQHSNDQRITDYMSRWGDLSIADKMTVVDIMIKIIRVTESKIQIEWKI